MGDIVEKLVNNEIGLQVNFEKNSGMIAPDPSTSDTGSSRAPLKANIHGEFEVGSCFYGF